MSENAKSAEWWWTYLALPVIIYIGRNIVIKRILRAFLKNLDVEVHWDNGNLQVIAQIGTFKVFDRVIPVIKE